MGLLETAASALVGVERSNQIAARNISNVQTPGYKREVPFTELVTQSAFSSLADKAVRSDPIFNSRVDRSPGALSNTGIALDLAIAGDGYLIVRDGDQYFLSRGGRLSRDAGGALVDAAGRQIQQVGGGDMLMDTDRPKIGFDGSVTSEGVPIGQIALVGITNAADTDDPHMGMNLDVAMALPMAEGSVLRQGMVERSNVVLSDEMMGLIRLQRMAEASAQMIRSYDGMLGQAVATFGRRNG